MANVLTVTKGGTFTAPGYGSQTFAPGDTVQPSSPYYYQLLWGGFTSDSGVGGSAATYKPTVDAADIARQFTRQRSDRRALQPLCTDVVTITADTTNDAACTKQYVWPTSGMTEGSTRNLTQAEQDACPIDIGLPTTRINHYLYLSSGFSYHDTSPVVPGYSGSSQIMPQSYKFWTDSARVQVVRYNFLGAQYSGAHVYVDGRPYSVRPVAGASIVDFLHLLFNDNTPHEVEIFSYALIGTIGWMPNYDIWKPSSVHTGPVIYTLSASDGTTVFADSGSASGLQEDVMHAEYNTYLGIEHNILDCIGGTGAINRTTGYQAPNNNFLDRMPALLRCNPDVLQHPTGSANDISYRMNFSGGALGAPTDAQIIAQMRIIWTAYRAINPNGKIIWGYGLPTPYFRSWIPQFQALGQLMQAACTDLGVYYIDNTVWLTGTGDTGNVKNDGNNDWACGPDHAHPTTKGARYLKRRWAACLRRILVDDGTLLNTVIS